MNLAPAGGKRKAGMFFLQMEAPASCHRCPKCGSRTVTRRGTYDRIVHAPPIGMDRTQLFIKAPRLECKNCEQVLNAILPHVVPLCNYTTSFARLGLKPEAVFLRRFSAEDVSTYHQQTWRRQETTSFQVMPQCDNKI
jgi:transposase